LRYAPRGGIFFWPEKVRIRGVAVKEETTMATKSAPPMRFPETPKDKAEQEAIEKVYQKYGTNLPAFFRDICEELEIKRQESSSSKNLDLNQY
jgi:hypothetical protein